jgi:hypothetical protein
MVTAAKAVALTANLTIRGNDLDMVQILLRLNGKFENSSIKKTVKQCLYYEKSTDSKLNRCSHSVCGRAIFSQNIEKEAKSKNKRWGYAIF